MSFIKNIVNSFFLILLCYLGGFLFRVGEGNNAIFYFFMSWHMFNKLHSLVIMCVKGPRLQVNNPDVAH